MLWLAVGIIAVIIVEFYYIYAFIRARMGKYPPYFPSFGSMKKHVLEQARLVLKASDRPLRVTDLGCGGGGLLVTLAKEFPQHSFTGYDWDIVPFTIARVKTKKYKNITLVKDDFFNGDYRNEDLIIAFTGNEIARQISEKLRSELPKNAVVVSEAFSLPDWTCANEIQTSRIFKKFKVYVYRMDTP